jgi:2-oxoglutarate ferredoxin oxidoreductase subunit beta
MIKIVDINTFEKPQWCPGCGDYGILIGIKQAIASIDKELKDLVIVSGIGCGGKIPHYIRAYGYEGLHGRLLPLAMGIKMANPDLTVIAIGGDGDGLSEGGNHLLHAARYNVDITYILQDNQVYGLTTGQSSPTSPKGLKTKTFPDGTLIEPVKQIPMLVSQKTSFVATAYAGNVKHMVEVIKAGILHKGFSYINVYQPCVTWNYQNTYEWYSKRIYITDHNPEDFEQAWKKANEPYDTNWEKIPLGIIYKNNSLTFDDEILQTVGNLRKSPVVNLENIFI